MNNNTEKWKLLNFESWVDATIQSRGRSYSTSGAVRDLEQIRKNIWVADVEGSYLYSVEIELDEEFGILGTVCNCPYDHGPICKHIVAVLYDLRDQFFEPDDAGTIKPGQSFHDVDTGQTVEQELDAVMSEIPAEDLRKFLKELLMKDRQLRSRFNIRFARQNELRNTDDYKELIRDLLAPFEQPQFDDDYDDYYDDSYDEGFIDQWDEYSENFEMLDELLGKAEEYVETGKPEKAVPICKAMIEEVQGSMAYIYDSDGGIWRLIDWAFEILFRLLKTEPDDQLGKELYEYSLSNAKSHVYGRGDWFNNYLELAILLAARTEQKEEVEHFLLNCITSSDSQKQSLPGAGDYRKESLISKLAALYQARGKNAEVKELYGKYRDLPGIRKNLIQQAWEDHDFETVKKLAREGKQSAGYSIWAESEWIQWLLKAAEAENDLPKQRKYTKKLLFSTQNIDWFKRLKTLYNEDEWNQIVQEILQKFNKKYNSDWFRPAIIPSIYIEEKQWKKILEFVQENPRLEMIRQYDRWLKEHFFTELMELYCDAILFYMENHTGRKYYQAVCDYFDRMRDLGGAEEAYELADTLKVHFSNRPAMLEEFEKAGY